MKKIARIVWIGALSGLAFLAACWGPRGLSRAERKKLVKERESIEKTLAEPSIHLEDTGNWDFVVERAERYQLMNKLDSINFRLGKDIDLAKNVRRRELMGCLDTLYYRQYYFDNSLIYGPPDNSGSYYDQRTAMRMGMVAEIEEIKKELELLDQPEKKQNP